MFKILSFYQKYFLGIEYLYAYDQYIFIVYTKNQNVPVKLYMELNSSFKQYVGLQRVATLKELDPSP